MTICIVEALNFIFKKFWPMSFFFPNNSNSRQKILHVSQRIIMWNIKFSISRKKHKFLFKKKVHKNIPCLNFCQFKQKEPMQQSFLMVWIAWACALKIQGLKLWGRFSKNHILGYRKIWFSSDDLTHRQHKSNCSVCFTER